MKTRFRSDSGMSLIEVLVATAVLAIAIVIALVVYDAARKSFKRGENATEQQEAVRIAYDKLTADVRMLGYNVNPDGDKNRPDEQIEAALDHAIVFRGDFDAEDPAARTTPETALGGGAFNVVSTGNDEVVGYVLANPNGTGPDTIQFKADVGNSPRDGTLETVTVNNVVLNPTAGPYTLYRISLNNDVSTCCSGNFIVRTPVVENVHDLSFQYFNATSPTAIVAPGATETPAAVAGREGVTHIGVRLVGMTRDPDMNYVDPAEASQSPAPADLHYRKFTLEGDITPRNMRMRGIQDLNADVTPPTKPATPTLIPGHCNALMVTWALNPSADGVSLYRINYGTAPGAVAGTRTIAGPPLYLDGLVTGTTYYVTIEAQDAAGNVSIPSNETSAQVQNLNTPSAPASPSAAGNVNYITVNWTPVSTNTQNVPAADPQAPLCRDLAGYRVYRGDTSGVTASPGDLHANESVVHGPASPPFLDTPTINCHPYYYRVTAVDACGTESAPTNVFNGSSTTTVQPSKPANVQAHFTGPNRVEVRWDPVTTDVQGKTIAIAAYDVYRSEPTDPSLPVSSIVWGPSPVGTSTTTTFIDNGVPTVPGGLLVYYRIVAHDECVNNSDPSDVAAPTCAFSGTVQITTPPDNAVVAGVVPVTVVVSGGTDTYTGVSITYVHAVYGITRTFTSSTPGTTWTDTGWLANPGGPYTITAAVTNAGGCTATAVSHVQAGSVVGCCLSLFPTTTSTLTCASGGGGCKEVSYSIGNDRCLTAVQVKAMTISWTDYTGNNPQWQTARFNGTDIAGVGSWTTTYTGTTNQQGTATKSDFSPGPTVPYLVPMTSSNTTVVTYVFDARTAQGNRNDVFGTNQYTFTLLDSSGTPSDVDTTCNFQNLTVQ